LGKALLGIVRARFKLRNWEAELDESDRAKAFCLREDKLQVSLTTWTNPNLVWCPPNPSPRPHIRGAHWLSYWVGKKDQPDDRFIMLKWLPPIPVNVTGIEDLTTTVRDVGK
jgi:hypothetical protein